MWTGFDAGITAEKPVVGALMKPRSGGALMLDGEIADAAFGIQLPRFDSLRWTGVDATRATSAGIAGVGLAWLQVHRGDNLSKQQPTSHALLADQ